MIRRADEQTWQVARPMELAPRGTSGCFFSGSVACSLFSSPWIRPLPPSGLVSAGSVKAVDLAALGAAGARGKGEAGGSLRADPPVAPGRHATHCPKQSAVCGRDSAGAIRWLARARIALSRPFSRLGLNGPSVARWSRSTGSRRLVLAAPARPVRIPALSALRSSHLRDRAQPDTSARFPSVVVSLVAPARAPGECPEVAVRRLPPCHRRRGAGSRQDGCPAWRRGWRLRSALPCCRASAEQRPHGRGRVCPGRRGARSSAERSRAGPARRAGRRAGGGVAPDWPTRASRAQGGVPDELAALTKLVDQLSQASPSGADADVGQLKQAVGELAADVDAKSPPPPRPPPHRRRFQCPGQHPVPAGHGRRDLRRSSAFSDLDGVIPQPNAASPSVSASDGTSVPRSEVSQSTETWGGRGKQGSGPGWGRGAAGAHLACPDPASCEKLWEKLRSMLQMP